MKMLVNVGYNHWMAIEEVVAIQVPKSAPVVRFIQECRKKNILINASEGKRMKSVIVLKSGYTMISALTPETIVNRLEISKGGGD